jgi:hypothetical protein
MVINNKPFPQILIDTRPTHSDELSVCHNDRTTKLPVKCLYRDELSKTYPNGQTTAISRLWFIPRRALAYGNAGTVVRTTTLNP